MTSLVKRRERIARVRRVEHAQAVAACAAAEAQLAHLRSSETRLTELRCSLSMAVGAFAAETLSSRAELALRLDEARFGLVPAIHDAAATFEARERERIEARKRQESAEKLGARAVDQAARDAERRRAAGLTMRAPRGLEDEA